MQRAQKIVNKAAPFVLLFYLIVGALAYVNVFPGSAKYFYSSSTSGVIIRAASSLLLAGYSVAVFFLNPGKAKFPWPWIIAFGIILFGNLITMLAKDHHYVVQYQAALYGYLREVSVTAGLKSLITMYLSSLSDFALGFCFCFLLPIVFNKREQLLVITLPIVLFMLLECGYSVIKEHEQYAALFSEDTAIYGGYNLSIGATFGDKQEFGAFLTIGFCAAFISCFTVGGLKKPLRYALVTGLCLSGGVFFVITFFTLCKTAILANSLAFMCLLGGLFVYLFRRKKALFWTTAALIAVAIVSMILILAVEQLHSEGILNRFYVLIDKMFLSKINHGIWSRFELVERFFRSLNGVTFLFGLSKGGVNAYMASVVMEGPGLHTGFVYFQACYGLIATLLYAALLFRVLRNHVLLTKCAPIFGLGLLGCLLCTLVFNLSECEVLIISGSAPIFLFNIINVVLPEGLVRYAKA